jgi:hypothetical protein
MKLKLFTLTNNNYLHITNEYWLKSIPRDIDDIILHFLPKINGKTFMTVEKNLNQTQRLQLNEFREYSIKKVEILIDYLSKKDDSIIIFSDSDIIFFNSFKNNIIEVMENNDFMMSNNGNGHFNLGFFAVRANEKNLLRWEKILGDMKNNNDMHEQITINKNWSRYDLSEDNYLDNKYWANRIPYDYSGTIEKRFKIEDVCNAPPEGFYLLHACATYGDKSKVLENIKNYFNK